MTTARYMRLLGVQARASLANSMQYRADFFLEGFMSLYWLGWNIVPLFILFSERKTVAGWEFSASLVVVGWFTVLRGLLEGAINPSLVDVVERIRSGEFDYVLLKPADTQFLVSTARLNAWKLLDMLSGIGVVVAAFWLRGQPPALFHVALALVMLLVAALILYSMWILIVAACFYVVKMDNLTYLVSALFDAARWPVQVFRGFWRVLFTLVIPLALMTTYPAMAVLGTLSATAAAASIAGAAAAFLLSRWVWSRAIGHYTSASS